MRSSTPRFMPQYGLQSEGTKGVHPWAVPQPYTAYKSRYGPSIKQARWKLGQYDLSYLRRIAPMAGAFGVSAGVFALFFFDGVPRVQKDILQKVPFIGGFFKHEIPADENPF